MYHQYFHIVTFLYGLTGIEKLIEEHQRQLEKNRRKTLIKHAIDVQDRLRRKSCKWDGVSEIREWREMVK